MRLATLRKQLMQPPRLASWREWVVGLVAVEFIGGLVRGLVLRAQPGVWYFPDSKAYIYSLTSPRSTAPRPGSVASFWYYLSFGHYHQHNIVLVQFIAGMIAIALLYDAVRRISGRWSALLWGGLYAALPIVAVFERTIMTEALTLDFLVGFFWAACIAFTVRPLWLRLVFVVTAIASLAAGGSIRTALWAPGIATAAVCISLWVVSEILDRRSVLRVLSSLVAVGLCITAFVIPLQRNMTHNQQVFGFRTINAMAGSFLASRWESVMPCTSSLAKQSDVRAALHQLCHAKSTSQFPGFSMNLVWKTGTPIFQAGRLGPSLALDQQELSVITKHALLKHPTQVMASVGAVSLDELFGPLFVNIVQYDNGAQMWVHEGNKQHRSVLIAWTQRDTAPKSGTMPVFGSIVRWNSKIPQVLLWLVLLGVLYRLSRFIWFDKARGIQNSSYVNRRLRRARVSLASIASVFVIASVLSVALSAFASFRYVLVLLPALIVLLALTWGLPPLGLRPQERSPKPAHDKSDILESRGVGVTSTLAEHA